jgi:hypothetical protein
LLAVLLVCTTCGIWVASPQGKVTIRFDGWKDGRLGRIACFTVFNGSRRRVTVAETYVGENPYYAIRDLAFKWKTNEILDGQTITPSSAGSFWDVGPPAPEPFIEPHGTQALKLELWEGVQSVDFAVVPGVVWSTWQAEGRYAQLPSRIRNWFIRKAVREPEIRDPKCRIHVELPGAVLAKEDSFWTTPALTHGNAR